jgi:hypothetical protein
MAMQLLLGGGNWREDMWVEIFDRAKKRGKIVDAKLGEYEFQYASINSSDGYGRDKRSQDGRKYEHFGKTVTFWIKDAEKNGEAGLNYGGLCFVLEKALPKPEFADYVGLHEHGEVLFRSEPGIVNDYEREKHGYGCITDLTEVLKREPEFIDGYADWVVKMTRTSKVPHRGYFGRAIPDFVQLVMDGELSPADILREFKRQLDAGYHLREPVAQ